jgi:hypothetical protein
MVKRFLLAALLTVSPAVASIPPPDAPTVIPQTFSPLTVTTTPQTLAALGVSSSVPIHYIVMINYGSSVVYGRGDGNTLSASSYTFQLSASGGSYSFYGNPLGYQLMCATGTCVVAVQIFN